MADTDSERGGDWRLPEASRPPLIGELVERIDEALATARASEAAVMTVGAAALDAAEQAKRAAELAEWASAAVSAASRSDEGGHRNGLNGGFRPAATSPENDAMRDFTACADRVSARLRRLERASAVGGLAAVR